jgi:purine-binding chemotaxis protein CheW
MEKQLVIFKLDNEEFGVDIASIESIIKMEPITRMPNMPGFVEGVINLRGLILPVIDLHRRFHLSETPAGKNTRIIIAILLATKVGMIVDSVSEVLRIPEEAVQPLPPLVTSVDSAFITGIARVGTRLVILLDLARVLNKQEQSEISDIQ